MCRLRLRFIFNFQPLRIGKIWFPYCYFLYFCFFSSKSFAIWRFTICVQTLNLKSVFFFLGISFFCTVLPYILYTFGLRGLETGHAAIIVTIEPLVGCLIGIFLWKEELSLVKVLGILLIFAAVVLCGRKKTV